MAIPHLPTDIIEHIIKISDINIKYQLYICNALQSLVSPIAFESIEDDIISICKQAHARKLSVCLSCLKNHVWEDGTPMKSRQRHTYKNCNKFRTNHHTDVLISLNQ